MKVSICRWATIMSIVALFLVSFVWGSAQAQMVRSQDLCSDVIQPLANAVKSTIGALGTKESSVTYKKELFGVTVASVTIHWELVFGAEVQTSSDCSNTRVIAGYKARIWTNLASVSGRMHIQAGVEIETNRACVRDWTFRDFEISGLSNLLDAAGDLVGKNISLTDLANAILSFLRGPLPDEICVNISSNGGTQPPPALPQINSLSPSSGPPGVVVTVNGTGFRQGRSIFPIVRGSQVLFDNNSMSTTFISTTQLRFTVPSDATCGSHNVQVSNPKVILGQSPDLSNIVTFTVTSPCSGGPGPTPVNQLPNANFSFTPTNPTVGQPIQFTDQSTDPDGATDIASWSWDFGDGTTSTMQNPTHTYNVAATFTVRLIVTDNAGNQGTAIKGVAVNPTGTPPPPTGGTMDLESFDTNNNGVIDDPEFFAIIDAWVAGQIDNVLFFQAVDLWVSQGPISSVGLRSSPLRLDTVALTTRADRRVIFATQGEGIAALGVEIFDLSGTRIFAQETSGARLVWNMNTNDGRPVANGVYLYVVTVRDLLAGGSMRSEVKKLVIQR